ncbi:MAG: hypothetical protein JWO52_5211 [Gammaproteobacteria bacterium]|nr:hypothetical protein [Gammaproteobacteria bacterium]
MRTIFVVTATVVALGWISPQDAAAGSLLGADEGKLPLTAGFSDLEGSGGGGLVPFAFISGYGSSTSWGANAHFTNIQLRDLHLYTYGAAVGLLDRFELSYTRQQLDVTGTALNGLGVKQDVYGLKVKLLGDAIYGQDSWLPQVAIGAQYKHNDGIKHGESVGLPGLINPMQLGAQAEHSTDIYLAATKVFLAESLLVNVVVRETKANQFGLLGFGGDRHRGYSTRPEGTIAYLLTRKLAVGGEIRTGPHNLGADDQTNAWTLFAAWTPTSNLSLVAAYLNIGSVLAPVTTVTKHQDGPYLSVQAGF